MLFVRHDSGQELRHPRRDVAIHDMVARRSADPVLPEAARPPVEPVHPAGIARLRQHPERGVEMAVVRQRTRHIFGADDAEVGAAAASFHMLCELRGGLTTLHWRAEAEFERDGPGGRFPFGVSAVAVIERVVEGGGDSGGESGEPVGVLAVAEQPGALRHERRQIEVVGGRSNASVHHPALVAMAPVAEAEFDDMPPVGERSEVADIPEHRLVIHLDERTVAGIEVDVPGDHDEGRVPDRAGTPVETPVGTMPGSWPLGRWLSAMVCMKAA